MVLHSLRTNAGISLSVVDELVSISSMASMISSGENLISPTLAEVHALLGEVLSVLRQICGGYMADIWRIYGRWSADMQRIYSGHSPF